MNVIKIDNKPETINPSAWGLEVIANISVADINLVGISFTFLLSSIKFIVDLSFYSV